MVSTNVPFPLTVGKASIPTGSLIGKVHGDKFVHSESDFFIIVNPNFFVGGGGGVRTIFPFFIMADIFFYHC